ncbi:MAG: YybH family protein, partial [Gemmatimonadales bacterium]
MSRLAAASTAALLVMLAPAPRVHAQVLKPPVPARTGIDRGNAEYIRALAAADSLAVAAVYDARGARLGPNGTMVRGRAAIAADVGAMIRRVGPVKAVLATADLWVIDDVAYETGRWSYTFTPPSGTEQTIGGRYVTVWRKQRDGGWKIAADIGVPA